jgi:hypothetical protein
VQAREKVALMKFKLLAPLKHRDLFAMLRAIDVRPGPAGDSA